jgi:hypothetical protein
MATLTVEEIECVRKQDALLGPDEVRIDFDGSRLAGPLSMRRNDVITVNASRSFTGSADIVLVEEDPGDNDDVLGRRTVSDAEAGLGQREATFHELPGADYHIRYFVEA